MTDERQNLDSDPSTTATGEPPGEQAAAEPAEGQAAPPAAAASTADPGEEGESEGEAPAAVEAAETAAPVDAEGEAVSTAAPAAVEGATDTAPAEAPAQSAATTEGAAVAEEAEAASPRPQADATPNAEGAVTPEQAGAATPQAEAGASPTSEGGAAAEQADPATSQAEAGATPTSEGAAAAEQVDAATPRAEADATPTPEGAAAAEQAQPTTPRADAGTASTAESAAGAETEATAPQAEGDAAPVPAAAEAPAASEQPPAAAAAEAPAAAEQPLATEAAATAPEEPEDPALAELREAREKGTPVEGRVIGWNRGGFHVVVGAVTAFCPSSEMEVGRPKGPQSYVEKTLSFKVIKYQKKGRRVVLSRAGLLAEQRQEVLAGLKPGSVVKGRVTSLPEFGAFVDLGGVEGLVHVSEISRSRVQHPKDALQPGQEVEVKVLKVEQDGERISLSMKDLEPDPWQGAGKRFNRGDRFSGKALRRTEFGLFVELEPEVEGLLHVSQLPPGKTLDDPAYQPGQPIEGWVREIEPKRQRISLSLREVPTDDPWKEIAKRFPEGEMVEGMVESIAPFGVFVVLAPGVTGLLPNSQTGLPRGASAARAFAPGQSTRVQVISVDARRKRISLGREGTHVEASRNDLQDFKRQEREREREKPTAMAAAFARLRGDRDEEPREEQ